MTVAVAMIARDAGSTIGAALASVRPYVDQVVVVDTGSVDDTKLIAAPYADTLLDFVWIDDFSAARQFAFDACDTDWIMHLDSDDVVQGGEHIRTVLANVPEGTTSVFWKYITAMAPGGGILNQHWRERAVKRGTHVWRGRCHEVLISLEGQHHIREESVVILHKPPARDPMANLERNHRILRKQLAEQDPPDSRTLFYLARDCSALGQYDESLDLFRRYFEVSEWTDERYTAQTIVAWIHRLRKDYEAAIDADLAACKMLPMWPQAYFGLAETYYFLGDWGQSVFFSQLGQLMPLPDSMLFTSPEAYTYSWMIFQVVALSRLGRHAEALALTERALALHPDDPTHQSNRAVLAALVTPNGAFVHPVNELQPTGT